MLVLTETTDLPAGCCTKEGSGEVPVLGGGTGKVGALYKGLVARWGPLSTSERTERQTDMTENVSFATPLHAGENNDLYYGLCYDL